MGSYKANQLKTQAVKQVSERTPSLESHLGGVPIHISQLCRTFLEIRKRTAFHIPVLD